MTEKQIIAKIISKLRQLYQWYDPNRKACLELSKVKRKNLKTSRMITLFRCIKCERIHEKIKVDHIIPIGKQPSTFLGLGKYINTMFCDITNLQPLCDVCHTKKTLKEAKERNDT